MGGATVLIRQAQPDWSAMQVREAMMMTASISSNPDNTYGYGILNAGAAIEYDQFTGINDDEGIIDEPIPIGRNSFHTQLNLYINSPAYDECIS